MTTQPFWMVYGLHQGKPTMRHKSYASARQEAERLARAVPGVQFFILQAVGMVEKVDVRHVDLRAPSEDDFDEIPF